jgi:hypothetical protein
MFSVINYHKTKDKIVLSNRVKHVLCVVIYVNLKERPDSITKLNCIEVARYDTNMPA